MIKFYRMKGCSHCEHAEIELDPEIQCGKIILLEQKDAPKGIRGFPYFEHIDANKNILKTSTGWSGKQNLFNILGYTETETRENYESLTIPPITSPSPPSHFQFNVMDGYVPFYRQKRTIETFSPELYPRNNTNGGYLKLNNCWTKQPDFTS